MVQFPANAQSDQILLFGRAGNLSEQFVVEFSFDRRFWRAKHREIALKCRPLVCDERDRLRAGACGEIRTTVSALLSMIRAVSVAIALIEFCTSTHDSPPTSGTMIGGCGAIPAKTNELVWPIFTTEEEEFSDRVTQIHLD
jgi:hypothetical protein